MTERHEGIDFERAGVLCWGKPPYSNELSGDVRASECQRCGALTARPEFHAASHVTEDANVLRAVERLIRRVVFAGALKPRRGPAPPMGGYLG